MEKLEHTPMSDELNKYLKLVMSMSVDCSIGIIDAKTYASNLVLIAESIMKLKHKQP